MPTEPFATAASVPAEGTWNQVLAEDAAQSIDRMTTAAGPRCPEGWWCQGLECPNHPGEVWPGAGPYREDDDDDA